MTAKDLKQQVINCFIAESGLEYPVGSIGWQMKQNKIEILHRFIDQLCKEQRELCADEAVNSLVTKHQFDKVLNAPTPEL